METFLLVVGVLLLLSGACGILSNALHIANPGLYTEEEVKDLKPIKYNAVVAILGIFVIGPAIWSLIILAIAYIGSLFISFNAKESKS